MTTMIYHHESSWLLSWLASLRAWRLSLSSSSLLGNHKQTKKTRFCFFHQPTQGVCAKNVVEVSVGSRVRQKRRQSRIHRFNKPHNPRQVPPLDLCWAMSLRRFITPLWKSLSSPILSTKSSALSALSQSRGFASKKVRQPQKIRVVKIHLWILCAITHTLSLSLSHNCISICIYSTSCC